MRPVGVFFALKLLVWGAKMNAPGAAEYVELGGFGLGGLIVLGAAEEGPCLGLWAQLRPHGFGHFIVKFWPMTFE